MGSDYLKGAEELIARLQNQGEESEASALREALEAGATGTEIAMALRFRGRSLLDRRQDLDELTRQQLAGFLRDLDEVLR